MSSDLRVIGAGMGRTCTTSLKVALETLLRGPCFHCSELSEETEKAIFEEHNRRVLAHAESDGSFEQRLLVWDVEQGWEPLCQALDLPVPDLPFPHANKRAED